MTASARKKSVEEHPQPGSAATATSQVLAATCARIAEVKRGEKIVVIQVGELLPVADYFVIVTGRNRRHTHTLAETIRTALKHQGRLPLGEEGRVDGRWILVDYGDVIVHLFQQEDRDYYDLENLWGDAPRTSWEKVEHLPVDMSDLVERPRFSGTPGPGFEGPDAEEDDR